MADEAFALSPISASPSLPSEADYDAIREAFMETSRGRWFLGEYARRNRNADTTRVLDAVARIEASLSAPKEASRGLADVWPEIRALIDSTRADMLAAIDGSNMLAAAREGVSRVRDVAGALRQCGADVRICDLLDAQATAIDAGLAATADGAQTVAALDTLARGIGELAGMEMPAADVTMAQTAEPPAAAALEETPFEDSSAGMSPPEDLPLEAAPFQDLPAAELHDDADETAVATQDAGTVAADHSFDDLFVAEPVPENIDPPTTETAADDDHDPILYDAAQDDVLGMIATEMAADEPADIPVLDRAEAAALLGGMLEPDVQDAEGDDEPEPQSLGAALIARGMVAKPAHPTSDPLGPIRRMSQPEKIAFFS